MLGKTIVLDRSQVVEGISAIRQTWEQAAEGESLVDVEASVGLLLVDIAQAIGLDKREREAALGRQLTRDFNRATSK